MSDDTFLLEQEIKKLKRKVSSVDSNGIYSYNLDVGLRKWRSQLASMQVSTDKTLNIQFLGDSITEGIGSDTIKSNWLTKGYVGLVRQSLANKFGDVGTGFIPTYYPTGSPFWTFSAGFVNYSSYGVNGQTRMSTSIGSTAQITFNGTGFVLMVLKFGVGGSFNVSVDGGANTLYTTIDPEFSSGLMTIASGLTDGTHTILITVTTGYSVYISGGYPIKGTKGIRCNMMGKSGQTSQPASGYPDCKPALIGAWNPALTVISFTANDFTSQTNLTTYTGYIQKLIDWAVFYNSDVLLTTIGMRSEVYNIKQERYFEVIRILAKKNNVALLDVSKRWVSPTSATTLGYYDDLVHPSAIGHQDIANILMKTIIEY